MLKNSLGLNLKLQNKLALTLSLRQQLELLLLPKIELENTIKQELDENPFLEEILSLGTDYKEPIKDLSKNFVEDDENLSPLNRLSYKPSLYDNLETQIELEFEGIEKEIAKEIINELDEKGLFKGDIKYIAKNFNVSSELVENVRQKLKKLEPTGIASLTLEEALWEQYKENFGDDERVKEIILNDLKNLIDKDYITENYQLSEKELEEIIDNIRTLNPYPTYYYSDEITKYVEPEAYVYDRGDHFEIILNEKNLPKLKLTNNYRKLISDKSLPAETKEFLEKKLQKAIGIIKGIELRRENLLKTIKFLVNYQAEFLRKGKKYIKPLTLKDVAVELGLHESTISRIVSNKYIQTENGLILLKSFFATKLTSANGDVSTEKVKDLIKEIINNEDKSKPLSDEKISKLLKEKYGIKIARRTVAKYREEMGIPSSKERKKDKK